MYTSEYLARYPFFRGLLRETPAAAMHDSLTGLIARPFILRFIQALIEEGTPFAMAIVDLDSFKSINDNFGHRTGDEMFARVASDLSRYLGESGVAGRYGGDEFLIVYFERTDYDGLIDTQNRLHDQDAGEAGEVEPTEDLLQSGLYAAHSLDELALRCPALERALRKLGFESVLFSAVSYAGQRFGTLVFCPEAHNLHIWQENESAAAFFLSRLLAQYLEQQTGGKRVHKQGDKTEAKFALFRLLLKQPPLQAVVCKKPCKG